MIRQYNSDPLKYKQLQLKQGKEFHLEITDVEDWSVWYERPAATVPPTRHPQTELHRPAKCFDGLVNEIYDVTIVTDITRYSA